MDYNGQLILCDNDRDKKLRVLVACEESQTVTIEFRKLGDCTVYDAIIEKMGL